MTFTTDKTKLDIDMIIDFLHNHSYWAQKRPDDVIIRSIENSICAASFDGNVQTGFGRIITDCATFYYLAEFFIIPSYQNKGAGEALMNYIIDLPELQGIRGLLTTRYAHGFYNKLGFTQDSVVIRERLMIKDT